MSDTDARDDEYDPFAPGPFSVGVRTIQALDTERNRLFPCEIWYPAAPRPATCPLILFSHSSGGGRRQSTFLCTHLSSHGYVVAAPDHSEIVAPELARRQNETAAEKSSRMAAWIANRVPDVRFLLHYVLAGPASISDIQLDPSRVGIVGHSFGGWTALAAADVEPQIRAVVALAPAGSSHVKPGMLRVELSFKRDRKIPTLYLVAHDDVSLPIAGMSELFERTPPPKQMLILRRADHLHFMDNVEQLHEAVRAMTFTGELAWLTKEMRPITDLCSGEHAHVFARGLTLSHMDAVLRGREPAQRFLAGDVAGELAARGIDAISV